MTTRALRLRVSTADALQSLNLLVQILLLWFCAVLVVPRVLMEVRDHSLTLPLFADAVMRWAGWLVRLWWLPALAVVLVGARLVGGCPSEQRPARLRLGLTWVATLATLLAAATAVATILGLVAVWRG